MNLREQHALKTCSHGKKRVRKQKKVTELEGIEGGNHLRKGWPMVGQDVDRGGVRPSGGDK